MNPASNQPELPPTTFSYHPSSHYVPPPGQYGQVPVLHGPPGIDANNQSISQSPHLKRSRSRSPARHDPYARPSQSSNMMQRVSGYPPYQVDTANALSSKHKELQRLEYAKQVKSFWAKQKDQIEKTDYKKLKHDLPLARIKKIMKSDDEVRMISAEVPILFSKACELFILDLTMRAWSHTSDTNRRTLQRSDVADAIMEGEGMDFLVDIVPREEDAHAGPLIPSNPMVPSRAHEHERDEDGLSSFTTDSLLRRMESEISGQRAMAAVPSAFPPKQVMQAMHIQQMNMGSMHR